MLPSSSQVARGKRSRCWETMLRAREGSGHQFNGRANAEPVATGDEAWDRVVLVENEIQALCELKGQLQGVDGAWPMLPQAAAKLCMGNDASVLPHVTLNNCTNIDRFRDWRNTVIASLLAQRGIPTVPLTPLQQQSWSHLGHGDCTHYCEPSEATLHAARAVLNMIFSMLKRPP